MNYRVNIKCSQTHSWLFFFLSWKHNDNSFILFVETIDRSMLTVLCATVWAPPYLPHSLWLSLESPSQLSSQSVFLNYTLHTEIRTWVSYGCNTTRFLYYSATQVSVLDLCLGFWVAIYDILPKIRDLGKLFNEINKILLCSKWNPKSIIISRNSQIKEKKIDT